MSEFADAFLFGIACERARSFMRQFEAFTTPAELQAHRWTVEGIEALCLRLARAGWATLRLVDLRDQAVMVRGPLGNIFAYRLSRTGKVLLQTGWQYTRLFEPKVIRRKDKA